MTLKDMLMSQPLSLWLSLAATLISLTSLFFSLKNQRRAQKLDTLQRRTQLILKLTEVRSQISAATINRRQLSLALSEFRRYSLLKNPTIKDDFAQIENKPMEIEPDLVEMEKRMEDLEKEVNKFSAKTNPLELEVLLPEVDRLKRLLENSNNFMISSIRALESRTKR